ncbi:MAG: hypothetical protein CUN55_13790 [Phototrophicales bacterium]|nr:MAG: hypothetical protein CUN55_13790 [Phototrophicales bacterium]
MRKPSLCFRPMIVLIAVLAAGIFVLRPPQTTGLAGETNNEIIIAGSGYMQQLLQDLVDNYQTTNLSDTNFRIGSEGSGPGFELFCGGEADAAMSTQGITDAQVLRCNENNIAFVELVLAIDHAVLVADADAEFSCINEAEVARIFRRSRELTLDDLLPDAESEVVTVYGPNDTNSAYTYIRAALLDDIEPSIDETFTDASEIVETLAEANNNAIALMTFNEWETIQNDELQVLSIRPASGGDCVAPTTVTLSIGEYPASRMLMLYANAESISNSELGTFLRYIFSATENEAHPISGIASALGFVAPDDAILDRDLNNVDELITGRTFTRTTNPTLVNLAAEGTLAIQGASISSFATNTFYNSFNDFYASEELEFSTFGDDAGWAALCNGEVNVIQVTRSATEEELSNCQVTPIEFFLGADAVVFVTAAEANLPMCLSNEQIAKLIGQPVIVPSSEDTESPEPEATEVATEEPNISEPEATETLSLPTLWSEIAPDWAAENEDLPLLVLVPSIGDLTTDVILARVGVVPNFRRSDAPTVQETPSASGLSDLDYRLGAVTTVDGAITYVRWSQYQNYANRDNLRLLQVGDECIAPNETTILEGNYPFSMSARLVFAQEGLNDTLVANLIWHLLDSDALNALQELNLLGFDRLAIESQRDAIFSLLEAAATAPAPEDTSEATEATPEATTAPTEEPTEVSTQEATEEPTVIPTEEPTAEPTAEATEPSE